MAIPRTYATVGAFRRALEERLKSMSQTEQIDISRLRRQVSFDRLLARLFREDPAPWVFEGWLCSGTSLQVRLDPQSISDLTLQRVVGTVEGSDPVRAIREMLQAMADTSFDDWFEYTIGPPAMDLTACSLRGARYSVETTYGWKDLRSVFIST